MKSTKIFKVNVSVELEDRYTNIELKASQYYFCEHLYTELEESRLDILKTVKQLGKCRIKMITVDLLQNDGSYYSDRAIKSMRMVENYNGKRISEAQNNTFNFNSEDSQTDMTPAEFLKKYINQYNKEAYYLYMKTLSEN